MKEKLQYEHFPCWQIDSSRPHKTSPGDYPIKLPVRLWESMTHFWNAKQFALPLVGALFHRELSVTCFLISASQRWAELLSLQSHCAAPGSHQKLHTHLEQRCRCCSTSISFSKWKLQKQSLGGEIYPKGHVSADLNQRTLYAKHFPQVLNSALHHI